MLDVADFLKILVWAVVVIKVVIVEDVDSEMDKREFQMAWVIVVGSNYGGCSCDTEISQLPQVYMG